MLFLDGLIRSAMAGSVVCLFCCPAYSQAPVDVSDVKKMRKKFQTVASQFQIATDDGTPLDLFPRPLVNWSNAERATAAGGMFMWTLKGRPMVAMCVYPVDQGYDHEFQSLADQPLTAESNGRVMWQPKQPGVSYRSLEATPPAASVPLRLRQMRKLAREFSGRLIPPNKTPKPLRLQSTPAYRYPPPKSKTDILDGALFTLVQGTDPEVLLVIEAVKDADGKSIWRYGLARMTMVPMQVMHKGTIVMETDWPANIASLPYYVIKEFSGK